MATCGPRAVHHNCANISSVALGPMQQLICVPFVKSRLGSDAVFSKVCSSSNWPSLSSMILHTFSQRLSACMCSMVLIKLWTISQLRDLQVASGKLCSIETCIRDVWHTFLVCVLYW